MHHRLWNTGQSLQTNIYKILQIIRIYDPPTAGFSNVNVLHYIFHSEQANLSTRLYNYQRYFLSNLQRTIRILLPLLGYSVLLCDKNLVEYSKNTMAEQWGIRGTRGTQQVWDEKKFGEAWENYSHVDWDEWKESWIESLRRNCLEHKLFLKTNKSNNWMMKIMQTPNLVCLVFIFFITSTFNLFITAIILIQ